MKFLFLLFFFSSRRRHTRLQGDWSSDVCSSDLYRWRKTITYLTLAIGVLVIGREWLEGFKSLATFLGLVSAGIAIALKRSEERRVGEECRSRWAPDH